MHTPVRGFEAGATILKAARASLTGMAGHDKIEETPMSEANKRVIRRLYGEVMANGDMSVADEIFHADYVDHMPIMQTPDRDGLLKSVEAARKAFPDVKPEIIAEIAEDDWVAIAVYADGGNHQDTYMGVPASGRHVTWTETHFWRVADGKIREHYGNVSMFEIHKMLGSHNLTDTLAWESP